MENINTVETMMSELTGMEMMVLGSVPKECFYEQGFESTPWVDCFLETVNSFAKIDSKQTRAILVSLQKKQFISISGDKSERFFQLEAKGKDFLKLMKLVDDNGYPIKGETK